MEMDEVATILHVEMDSTYVCDVLLKELGYEGRFCVSEDSQNDFIHMFGMYHINYFLSNTSAVSQYPPLTSSSPELAKPLESINQLLAWIAGGLFTSQIMADYRSILYYLQPYSEIATFFFDEEESSEEAIRKLSQTFNVHIVIMEHAPTTIMCHLNLIDGSAPIIHLETFAGHYCALSLRLTVGFPQCGDPDQILHAYSHYIPQPAIPPVPDYEGQFGDPDQILHAYSHYIPQPAIPPVPDYEGMRSMIDAQKVAIKALAQCLKGQPILEDVIAALETVRKQAEALRMDTEFYESIKGDVATYSPKPILSGNSLGGNSGGGGGRMPPPIVMAPPKRPNPSVNTVAQVPSFFPPDFSPLCETHPQKGFPDDARVPDGARGRQGKLPSPPNEAAISKKKKEINQRPARRGVSKNEACYNCKRMDIELYTDGNHPSCKVCFHCSHRLEKCPKCNTEYNPSEKARFKLLIGSPE